MSGLADALAARLDELASAFWTQAVVKPNATDSLVIVDVAGSEVRCPYLQSYTPRSGDVVWLAGPPGSWVCLGTVTGGRDTTGRVVTATDRFRGPLGAPGDAQQGYGQWHGNVSGDGAATQVDAGYVLSGGDMRANRDFNAGRSIAAAVNVFDGVGNLRTQSERALKDHLGDLDPDVVDRFAVGRFRFRADSGIATPRGSFEMVPLDPDDENTEWVERPVLEWVPDDTEHIGLYVDDLDDADPALVRRGTDGHRTFEDRGVLAYLTVAVQRARRENRELRARLDALERAGQGIGSSASRDQPPYPDHTGSAAGSDGA